jgi:hypothetical protein
MALEMQVITSHEFFRLGTHGELDWLKSLTVLSALVQNFDERGTDLAIIDVRDAQTDLTDLQLEALVKALKKIGVRKHHRIAILHRTRPHPRSVVFAEAAQERGFDIEAFDNYERAVEWLSRPEGPDPDFDRELYLGPQGQESPQPRKPPEGQP